MGLVCAAAVCYFALTLKTLERAASEMGLNSILQPSVALGLTWIRRRSPSRGAFATERTTTFSYCPETSAATVTTHRVTGPFVLRSDGHLVRRVGQGGFDQRSIAEERLPFLSWFLLLDFEDAQIRFLRSARSNRSRNQRRLCLLRVTGNDRPMGVFHWIDRCDGQPSPIMPPNSRAGRCDGRRHLAGE